MCVLCSPYWHNLDYAWPHLIDQTLISCLWQWLLKELLFFSFHIMKTVQRNGLLSKFPVTEIHTSTFSLHVSTCAKNSLVQFGAVPDHVPFARHWRVGEPVRKYPSIHEYTIEWEKVEPSKREIRPWAGVPGFSHCTAAMQEGGKTGCEGQRCKIVMDFLFSISVG